MVWDPRLYRITWLSGEGNLLGTTRLGGQELSPVGDPVRLRDGSLFVAWLHVDEDGVDFDRPRIIRHPATVVAYAPDGTVSDTLGEFPDYEEAVVLKPRRGFLRVPFGRSIVLAGWNGDLVLGTQDHYELQVFHEDRLARIVRAPDPDLVVTSERVDSVVDLLLSRYDDPTARKVLREVYENAPLPESAAAYGALLRDAVGDLWVARYAIAGETPKAWDVFDSDGIARARVLVPDRLQVLEAGADYVLGVWKDSLDVEHLRAYGLDRTRPPTR